MAVAVSLLCRVAVEVSSDAVQRFWRPQIPVRFIQFAWGIWVARAYMNERSLPRWLQGVGGFLVAGMVAYLGRCLMVTEVVQFAGAAGPICRVFGEPLMALGFAGLTWNVLCSPSWFSAGLGHPWMQWMGRRSYSLYLWHWWPCAVIAGYCTQTMGSTALAHLTCMALSLVGLLPISALSYHFLEQPYFKAQQR
jgi:peptidoglycan/LPS O-acetylase OafA/YrhL